MVEERVELNVTILKSYKDAKRFKVNKLLRSALVVVVCWAINWKMIDVDDESRVRSRESFCGIEAISWH